MFVIDAIKPAEVIVYIITCIKQFIKQSLPDYLWSNTSKIKLYTWLTWLTCTSHEYIRQLHVISYYWSKDSCHVLLLFNHHLLLAWKLSADLAVVVLSDRGDISKARSFRISQWELWKRSWKRCRQLTDKLRHFFIIALLE